MKFIDVKTDFAFKKVFGSVNSKDILISFLNAIIDFPNNETIIDLTYEDPYKMPRVKGMKDTYVDVRAELDNNTKVIIEMQVLNLPSFEKRILYNAAKAYANQLQKGEYYSLLNPVIALTITDFVMFDGFLEYLSCFKMIETKKLITYSDDVMLSFIELPKFDVSESELKTIKEKWIYFVKHAGKLTYEPETLTAVEEIHKAFEVANEATLSPEELEMQDKRLDFILSNKVALEVAEAKGEEKGMAQGIAKEKLEIAKNLLKANMETDFIVQMTGLSAEKVENLKRGKV